MWGDNLKAVDRERQKMLVELLEHIIKRGLDGWKKETSRESTESGQEQPACLQPQQGRDEAL